MKAKSQYTLLISAVIVSLLSLTAIPLYYIIEMYPAFTSALVKDKEIAASQIASHLTKMLKTTDGRLNFNAAPLSESANNSIREAQQDFGLVKIKVFSESGQIIYSTNKHDIGAFNSHPYFITQVMKGKNFSKIVNKEEKTMEGKKLSLDVIETYVPIIKDSRFLGAFELYYDVTEAKGITQKIIHHSQQMLLLVSFFLIMAVLFIAYRAFLAIRNQRRVGKKLRESNAELALLFDLSKIMSAGDKKIADMLLIALERITSFTGLSVLPKGAIFLKQEERLELTACLNLQSIVEDGTVNIQIGECLCGKCAEEGTLTLVDHCTSPCHCFKKDPRMTEHGHIVLPIKTADQILGVVLLYTNENTVISEREQRLLKTIARHIAVSISNQQHFARINELSLHDPLTGLANRRKMHDFLTRQFDIAKRYHKHISVIMVDIDFFKRYNDTYGHEEGDKVLAQVATILQEQVRKTDLASRFGGEEFILIMPETGGEPACLPAERIRKAIEQKTPVTISMGVACGHDEGEAKDLISLADKALYQAKAEGRNCLACAGHHDINEISCMTTNKTDN